MPLSQLGWIGGSYTGAAAIVGVLAARLLDRFDRRSALAVTLLGLVIATACGGMAVSLHTLMAARVLAGCFGGPATALSLSIIADVIAPARRGRALSIVMTAFTVATVVGLPGALEISRLSGWRSTFFAVAGLGAVVAVLAVVMMPPLRLHLQVVAAPLATSAPRPGDLRPHGATLLSLFAMFTAMVSSVAIMPNLSAFVQGNLHYPRADLSVLYFAAGTITYLVMRIMGPVIDRAGAAFAAWLGTIVFVALLACAFVAQWAVPAMVIYVAFMSSVALRNMSVNALATRVPLARERARFMSLQSAVQHLASALGAIIAAQLLRERPDRSLEGMPNVGAFAIAVALALPILLHEIEKRVKAREVDPGAAVAPVSARR